MRAIGHECGHAFYEGDTYSQELDEFARAAKETAARSYLKEVYPQLPELVFTARCTMEEFDELFAAREDLVATITKKAVETMMKSHNPSGELTVELGSGIRDGQGKQVLVHQAVTRPVAIAGFKVNKKSRIALTDSVRWAGGATVVRCEPHPLWRDDLSQQETIQAAAREGVIELESGCRVFVSLMQRVAADVVALRKSLYAGNLNELSRWGSNVHVSTPFWIRVTPDGVTAGKGPHVRTSGRRVRGLPLTD